MGKRSAGRGARFTSALTTQRRERELGQSVTRVDRGAQGRVIATASLAFRRLR